MNCKQAQASLDLLLSGQLYGEAARDVRRHLASCRECTAGLRIEQWTEVLPALDETIEPSGDFAMKFQAKLRNRPQPWWQKIAALGWPRQLAATGALAAVVMGGIFVFRYQNFGPERAAMVREYEVAGQLPLLQDMAVVSHLDLLEDFDTIEDLPNLMSQGAKN